MQRFLNYLTFIPWLLYFVELSRNAIKIINTNEINKEWLKKNFFNIFRFDTLILIGIFIYFMITYYHKADQIWLVEILLFSAINLYLYFNSYYDKNKTDYHIDTKDLSTILIILIIILIPLIYFVSTKNSLITYYILFGYTFFNFIIVYLAKKINDLIIKLILKKNHENK